MNHIGSLSDFPALHCREDIDLSCVCIGNTCHIMSNLCATVMFALFYTVGTVYISDWREKKILQNLSSLNKDEQVCK